MKKRIKKGLLALFCSLTLVLGLTGCSKEVNAYDIAVKNGFTGTEAEWLLSLHGANGEDGEDLDAQALYEAAKGNGYTGTFLEFCKELNIEIPQYNDTKTIANNMLSCVSVYCGFSNIKTATPQGTYVTPYGYSGGSGVIVDLNKEGGNAYLLTNYHVVYNGDSEQKNGISEDIWVYLCGGKTEFENTADGTRGDGMKASFVGGSMDYDIAILKIEGNDRLKNSDATEAKLGNSENVKVGEETYVIGNPSLRGISVTNGVLSVQSEYITIAALDNRDTNGDGQVDGVAYRVMRTSAAINSGNSGGGMFNTAGELIGIVNAKSSSSTVDNMGYALPINQVAAVCENIGANGGAVRKAMLGITTNVKTSSAELVGDSVQIKETFCVSEITYNSLFPILPPVAAAGKLQIGNIFLSAKLIRGGQEIDAITFTRAYQLTEFLLKVRQNDTVVLQILDNNNTETSVSITFDKDHYFTDYA